MDALQTRRAPLIAPAGHPMKSPRLRAALRLLAGCVLAALCSGCAWLEPLPEDGRSLSRGVSNTIEDFAGPERSSY